MDCRDRLCEQINELLKGDLEYLVTFQKVLDRQHIIYYMVRGKGLLKHYWTDDNKGGELSSMEAQPDWFINFFDQNHLGLVKVILTEARIGKRDRFNYCEFGDNYQVIYNRYPEGFNNRDCRKRHEITTK